MDARIRSGEAAHKLVLGVDADVVLVAVIRTPVLLGPARVFVLLGVLGRFPLPALGRLTALDRLVLVAAVALFGCAYDPRPRPPPSSQPAGPLPTCGASVDVRAFSDKPLSPGRDSALFVARDLLAIQTVNRWRNT
jgi:hypothetical protein